MSAREIPSPIQLAPSKVPPRAWLPKLVKLKDLMLLLGKSKIATVEALCREITKDYIAGDVLNELLRLFPMAIREDGAVWKDDNYWKNSFALSRYKMNKARGKLAPFIHAEVIKSGKAPCWHYWLNSDAIVSALSRIYGKSECFIESIVFEENSQVDFQRIITNRFSKNPSNSITTLKTNKTTEKDAAEKIIELPSSKEIFEENANDNEIVELLVKNGVWRTVARRYADLPREEVEALITKAQAAKNAGKLRQSFPSFLAGSLKLHKSDAQETREPIAQTEYAVNENPFNGLNWSDFAD